MAYEPILLTPYTTPYSRILSNHKVHHHLDTEIKLNLGVENYKYILISAEK